ncbi:MAG: hypothetical protein QNJ81_05905 [Acidimicrobiia bacterium]|nr:hypothetical protein [Acidimicrobiia bacterium]
MSTDPLGKNALFSPPPSSPAEDLLPEQSPAPAGKHALYSAGPRRPGTVVVECSRCLNHSRMTNVELGVRIAFFSLWIPGRRFSRWIQCPECERRTWCRVHWFG